MNVDEQEKLMRHRYARVCKTFLFQMLRCLATFAGCAKNLRENSGIEVGYCLAESCWSSVENKAFNKIFKKLYR